MDPYEGSSPQVYFFPSRRSVFGGSGVEWLDSQMSMELSILPGHSVLHQLRWSAIAYCSCSWINDRTGDCTGYAYARS